VENFSLGVASGVTAAFLGFVLKGWATSVVHGFRIRKLLTTDIKEAIRGLQEHHPQLATIEDDFANDSFAFIWDGSSNSQIPEYVTSAIYHLTALETTHCWRFYDVLSHINVIRAEYNNAVRHLIADETQREGFKGIATACLHDLGRNYSEAILVGSRVLTELSENHRLVEIDVAQCDADLRNFGKQHNH